MTGQLNRSTSPLRRGLAHRRPGSPSDVSGSWSPALSPDGRARVAYVSDRSGAPEVWVQPVGSDG